MKTKAYLLTFPVDFKLSRFRIIYSHHLVISVTAGELSGAGSGVLYRNTAAAVAEAWRSWLRDALSVAELDSVEASWPSLVTRALAVDPGLAFALDSALWDLHGQRVRKTVSELLGGRHRDHVAVTEQIFIDDWQTSRKELRQILDRGTTSLKIKVGFSPDEDLQLVKRVRQYVGADVELRLDANRAYAYADGAALYPRMSEFGILAVEEPIRVRDMEELAQFRQEVGLPVMLDESILTADDLKHAIRADAIDSLNIKLSRVGGISQALGYRRLCEDAGVSISIGCSEDLGPGMASILHLAAATEHLYSTEGVGHLRLGIDLIEQDMIIEDGRVAVPDGPGLGVSLHRPLPDHLSGRAWVYDLSEVPTWRVRGRSFYVRNRQRVATLIHRLRRRLRS